MISLVICSFVLDATHVRTLRRRQLDAPRVAQWVRHGSIARGRHHLEGSTGRALKGAC